MSPRLTSQLPDPVFTLLKEGYSTLPLTVGVDGFPNNAYTDKMRQWSG